MEKEYITETVTTLFEDGETRNFTQSVDFVVTLKDVDLDDPDDKVDAYVALPHETGEDIHIAALIGPELEDMVEDRVDTIVRHKDFDDYADNPRKAKDLADEHAFFLAQADVMPDVATTFGRYLGPRDKMPNPQLGTVINPGSNIDRLLDRLQRTVHIKGKKDPVVQVKVGNEDMDAEAVAENTVASYNELLDNLAKERNNIKDAYIKLTMSSPEQVL